MLAKQLRRATLAALVAVVFAGVAAGCGPTQFADSNALVITGTPPEPPPPPPPPPPPKPKRVEVTADKIVIREKIQFEFDKAVIRPESHGLLAEITQVIQDNPQIKKISIEGHTDSQGKDAYNQKLSEQRAAAVMDYLVKAGVDKARLTSKGFGETKPIADNETDEGREANRRVEFLITEQDAVKKTVEIDPKTGKQTEVGEEKAK